MLRHKFMINQSNGRCVLGCIRQLSRALSSHDLLRVLANHNHQYQPKKRYYAAKQLYHFVHVGAQRISVEGPEGMLLSGFVNGDDASVVVIGMQEARAENITISLPGSEDEWRVFQTTPRLDCEPTGTAVITNGSAQVHLDKESIFTLL